jgi:cardiolipin synthase
MTLLQWILISFSDIFLVVATAGHALLHKRDPRAAWGWIAVCLIFPLVGPLLYFLFGINRVKTRAKKLQWRPSSAEEKTLKQPGEKGDASVAPSHMPLAFAEAARISDAVTMRPLVGGNQIYLLHNGEEAYPMMLEAIENACQSVFLTTYIFETNHTGLRFIDALARATARGVMVRVLIDGIGEWYSIPRATTLLKKRNVPVARFLPPKLIPPAVHINLRNHRKILVADGHIGFVGGMNIGDRHLAEIDANPSRVIDLHFCLKGPIVTQIEHVFLEDWQFSARENIEPAASRAAGNGEAICRAIVDGPNEDLDKLAMILLGAVSVARKRILIMTPYFLPSRELTAALKTAVLRGVEVTVILPSKNNLPFVHWATNNMLWELLERGVAVYCQPPPFVHTKLFVVDDYYAQIGSANMDPRSLRLNFELGVEIYDTASVQNLAAHIHECLKRSRKIEQKDLASRPFLIRARDAFAWLFSPYL